MKTKHLLISFFVALTGGALNAQNAVITEIFEFNDFRWNQTTSLQLFHNRAMQQPGIEIPAYEGNHTMFISNLWIGGIDQDSVFHAAGKTYECETGSAEFCEYIPGPVRLDGTADSEGEDFLWYNRYWMVTGIQVENHQAYFDCLNDPGCDEEMQYPDGYQTPQTFITWPALGDSENGFAPQLAPFVDANENGTYDPENGDYPDFCGDFCTYFISNDAATPHSFTQAEPLGFEIHTMVYGYESASEALTNTLFVRHELINRSENSYTDLYVGSWNDFDIGNFNDDYVGTDVQRSMIYGYNADPFDDGSAAGPGYGDDLPDMGVRVLEGPKKPQNGEDDDAHSDDFDTYGNQTTGWGDGIEDNERLGLATSMHQINFGPAAMSDPGSGVEMYNYLQGSWLNGAQLVFGGFGYNPTGELPTKYVFPGNTDPLFIGTDGVDPEYPSDEGWSEVTVDNSPGDRRMLSSTGPFELAPGESDYINYAFVFARDSYDSEETPLETLQRFSDEVVSFACAPPADIVLSNNQREAKKPSVSIFPNPATDRLSIELPNSGMQAKVFFHDSSGRLVDSFSTNGEAIISQSISLTPGAYLVTIQTEAHTWTEKMVVQP